MKTLSKFSVRGTVLTGAVESKESRMVEEVLGCIRDPLLLSVEAVRHGA